MTEVFWNMRLGRGWWNDSPRSVLGNTLADDLANYRAATEELSPAIGLLDSALALYIELLQVVYRDVDKWKENNRRASYAMAVSTLNYMFLARHAILLGYSAEALSLLRDLRERWTRLLLFGVEPQYAGRFLKGEQIGQQEVDKALGSWLKGKPDENIHELRKGYRDQSMLVHPNLASFRQRTFVRTMDEQELSDNVGVEIVFGGVQSRRLGMVTVLGLALQALLVGRALRNFVVEESGSWDADYESLRGSIVALQKRSLEETTK